MTKVTKRMDLLEEKLEGLEARIEARIRASMEEKMGLLETENETVLAKRAVEEHENSNHKERDSAGIGSDLDYHHSLDEYRMTIKKVELPVFNGEDPIGWITGAETCFEVKNILEEVKIKLAKLSMEGSAIHWFNLLRELLHPLVQPLAKHSMEGSGRTVACTIHQPSIDIFEAFDELILMKTGGRIIYFGPLGEHSSRVIEYFESIPGVPKIKDNYNPSTWMLEVTSRSAETELGVDFAQIYREATLYIQNKELVEQLSSPRPDSKDLYFPSHFPRNGWEQFKACLWKQHLSYWRSPSYNLMRIIFVAASSFVFGILFWKQGKKINSQQDLFNVFGSMFAAALFFGINNCSTVLPYVTTERTVLYRERFAGMYSPWAYSFAQVLIEVPYLFIQAALYVIITYPMIGHYWSAYKIFWSFLSMFCNMLYFNYLGMLIVSLTPNVQVASIVASSSYTMLNLFSGYFVPRLQIPKWWIWLYYLCPMSWALNGMLTSQYGDVNKNISAFGDTKTVATFLEDYYGFHYDFLGVTGVVLIAFPIVLALLFAYCIGNLNFQRR